MPPINPADIQKYPATLQIVPLTEANGDPNVFAFFVNVPTGTQFSIACTFGPGVVDPKMATKFVHQIANRLLLTPEKLERMAQEGRLPTKEEKADDKFAREWNASSIAAMMQKLIVDFNNRRRGDALAQVECGTRLQ